MTLTVHMFNTIHSIDLAPIPLGYAKSQNSNNTQK